MERVSNVLACLFRGPSPGVLNVTVRGIFDLCNNERVPKKPVTAATTSIMAGFDNGVGIGQVKKLKLVARRYQSRGGAQVNCPRASACYIVGFCGY
ncbi:hypothetical protein PR003_g18729 [Phytophthora rubi]|uniref:Uncharacterized protein n=1 Tax=Phytophthora rubi TaxID=129364 RepID=A0A6A4EBJ6_9STRA|nr:hypothetical protein PR001_g8187 [Phytophthora rubi]KAE9316401.1 hypothetical protein PR003_g18729 [Phytophthora rubi]